MIREHLIWCIVVNILTTLLSIGVLCLYPAGSGFTFTSGTTTHVVQAGPLIAALLMIGVGIVIAAYLAFCVYASV